MNILLIAGEPSGDLHGAMLLRELPRDYKVWGSGGDLCREKGMELLAHVSDLSVMGFWEVLPKLMWFKKLEAEIVRQAKERKPAAAVLIDYPGFNLSIAPKLKALGIPVIYYISPQLWAWKEGRVRKIRRYVDRMITILPFEPEFYRKHNITADYVGHPFMDIVQPEVDEATFRSSLGLSGDYILLMPGSRWQEFHRHMPVMVEVYDRLADRFPDLEWVTLLSSNIDSEKLDGIIGDRRIKVLGKWNYRAMTSARFGLVTSGSATLEAGICALPHFVVYRTSPVTYMMARSLVKIDRIGLVNLVADRMVSPEFVQQDCTPKRISEAMLPFLESHDALAEMKAGYGIVRERLGEKGAAARAAGIVVETVQG